MEKGRGTDTEVGTTCPTVGGSGREREGDHGTNLGLPYFGPLDTLSPPRYVNPLLRSSQYQPQDMSQLKGCPFLLRRLRGSLFRTRPLLRRLPFPGHHGGGKEVGGFPLPLPLTSWSGGRQTGAGSAEL